MGHRAGQPDRVLWLSGEKASDWDGIRWRLWSEFSVCQTDATRRGFFHPSTMAVDRFWSPPASPTLRRRDQADMRSSWRPGYQEAEGKTSTIWVNERILIH